MLTDTFTLRQTDETPQLSWM